MSDLTSLRARFEEISLLDMEQRALDAMNSELWIAVQVARDSLAMIEALRKLRRGLASARTGRRRSARGSKQKRMKRG